MTLKFLEGRISRWENPWTPAILKNAGWPGWLLANIVTVVSYFALGEVVGQFFAAYGLFPAPIWLPTGVATVAAMAGGVRLLPGIFLGSFLANALLFAPPLHVTFVLSLTNATGPVVGAVLLRRLRPPRGVFTSFPGVLTFLICMTFISPAVSATGGAVGMSIGAPFQISQFYSTWVNWWITDGGGTLYLAPALILWLQLERDDPSNGKHFERRDLWVWAWVAIVSVVLFLTPPLRGTYIRSALPFLLVVPLSWIALRMSLRYAYTLVTVVSIAATVGTVAGFGPFQDHGLANPLQLVGVLVVLLAMNVLTIVALFNERQDAENANKVKSMFLANTSHELRTPLNAIIGYSSLIARQAAAEGGNAQHAGWAASIQSGGEHLLALINDLLEMSKIEAGRFDLDEAMFPLANIVAEAVDLVRYQADAKSIALLVDLPQADAIVTVDGLALRRILLNLLSNAVKFTPTGGQVSVTAGPGDGGGLAIRIADNGVGIPENALERVFQPFERVVGALPGPVEGTGLGLSITRGLATLHGGTVTLTSTLGHGTTATVTLPASRVSAAKAESRALPEGAPA